MDFDGNLLKQWEELITVEANKSNKYIDLLKNDILNVSNANNAVLHAELLNNENNSIISENLFYLSPYKELKLTNPGLTLTVNENFDEFEIILKTQKLAKDVYLTADSENNFSDNYFDMLPNTEKKVTIRKSQLENLESFIEKLKVITLFDSYIN